VAEPTRDGDILAQLADGTLAVDLESGLVFRNGRPSAPRGGRYLRVYMGDRRTALAHRVVWLAAHGPIPAGYEVDHKNGDREDNRLANLQAITAAENTARHARRDHLNYVRPGDVAATDPTVVEKASTLATRQPSRTEIADFMWRARNMAPTAI
jgi:hypothetical protein